MKKRLERTADILLKIEPVWVLPLLGYSYTLTLALVPGPSYLAWVYLALACIPFILRKLRWDYFSVRSAFEIPALIFLAGAIVGLTVSIDVSLSLRTFQSLIACILLFYMVLNYKHPKPLLALIVIICSFALIYPGIAYIQRMSVLSEEFLGTGRWLIWLADRLPQMPQPAIDGEAIITRTSAYGMVVPLLLPTATLLGIALFGTKISIRLISVLFFAVFMFMMFSIAGEGIARLIDGVTVSCRLTKWQDTIYLLKENPITGLGLGMPLLYTRGIFADMVAEGNYNHVHNSYLELYANVGILGVIAAVIAAFLVVKVAIRIVRTDRSNPWYSIGIGYLLFTFGLGFLCIFDTMLSGHVAQSKEHGYYYVMSMLPWLLGACLVAIYKVLNQKANDS